MDQIPAESAGLCPKYSDIYAGWRSADFGPLGLFQCVSDHEISQDHIEISPSPLYLAKYVWY